MLCLQGLDLNVNMLALPHTSWPFSDAQQHKTLSQHLRHRQRCPDVAFQLSILRAV
jgi:hypothetical protein